jgi:hypothetical protein
VNFRDGYSNAKAKSERGNTVAKHLSGDGVQNDCHSYVCTSTGGITQVQTPSIWKLVLCATELWAYRLKERVTDPGGWGNSDS